MRRAAAATAALLLLCAVACGQTVEGKKIVGGHGHAMLTTWLLREHIDEIKRAPLDGVMIHVNRNDLAGKEKLRELRPLRWFRPPAVTIEDFSIALDDLAKTDLGHLKHNILWTAGTRNLAGGWFDDAYWETVAIPNARAMAEVYKRGGFEAVWFDVEVGGYPGGGPMTWKGKFREQDRPFEDYAAKVRQRGREMMEAFASVVPDFQLMISHAYGAVNHALAGRDPEEVSQIEYGLLPAFCDGVLEGCGEKGRLIESGETTYGTMTYAGYKAWREWERASAKRLSKVPQFLEQHYGQALAMWPDFRSDTNGWNTDDVEKNHFSPERMKHAFHNALAASDEFVWTWSWHAHWWPNRSPVPGYEEYRPTPDDRKHVIGEAYLAAMRESRETMDLDWHPERTSEESAPAPTFDVEKAFADLGDEYSPAADLSEAWLFHPADSSTPAAFSWGIPLSAYGRLVEDVYAWRPIKVGDTWENQGVGLDGTGVYRATFTLPEEARSKRIYAAVAGVAGKATIFVARKGVREKSVGRCQGEAPALFDITDAIDFAGDNTVTIVVASLTGPGGIFGDARIVARAKGREGYAELRGKEKGKWFHWIKSTRLKMSKFAGIAKENTVEARLRVPDEGSFNAQVWCTTEDGGWHMKLGPKGVTYGDKWFANTSAEWHTYRIVTARDGDKYRQTVFVDGAEKLKAELAPVKSEEPRHPAIGFGISWGTKDTVPVKMDVDTIRWASRAFTPEEEETARADTPEAQERKEIFWDGAYEGDVTPDAEDWVWWYDWDPRPHTRIVYQEQALDLGDAGKLVVLYDWATGKGGKLIPRDVPRLDETGEVHGDVAPEDAGNGLVAKISLVSAKELGYGWPALTATDLAIRDWSGYAGLAMKFRNPTENVQEIGICVRDSDKTQWSCIEKFVPGETKVLGGTIDEIRAKLLASDIWAVTAWTRNTTSPQTFQVSPIYLVKR